MRFECVYEVCGVRGAGCIYMSGRTVPPRPMHSVSSSCASSCSSGPCSLAPRASGACSRCPVRSLVPCVAFCNMVFRAIHKPRRQRGRGLSRSAPWASSCLWLGCADGVFAGSALLPLRQGGVSRELTAYCVPLRARAGGLLCYSVMFARGASWECLLFVG